MKILFFLILTGCAFGEEAGKLQFKINIEDTESSNYSSQLKAALTSLLNDNKQIADKFHKMEDPPPSEARGRYSGEPIVQAIVLAESENVNFSEAGGEKDFEKTIALYYRFDEGVHRGSQSHSGFFAIFVIEGKLNFEVLHGEKLKVKKSEVFATFKGFERSIAFPATD